MTTKSAAQLEADRNQADCEIIWGAGSVYDIDVEGDDCGSYMGVVQKDLGTEYSETFIVSGVHKSAEAA